MELKTTTGYYANFFDEKGFDLFVILNELNKKPTTDDYIFIENTITEHIDRYGCIDVKKLKYVLDEQFEYGVQIINHSTTCIKL